MIGVAMVSDPQNREAIWLASGDMSVLYYDGHPMALLNHGMYWISDNVATTRGAGVLIPRWASWARDMHHLKKMPEKRVVAQQYLNEELACSFFHNLALFGIPLGHLVEARRLMAEAEKRGEPKLSWQTPERIENMINNYERLRGAVVAVDLMNNRIEAEELVRKCREESEKRRKAREEANQPAHEHEKV